MWSSSSIYDHEGCSRMAGSVDSVEMSSSLVGSSSSDSGGVERGKGYEQAAALAMWWNHAWHADEGKLVRSIEQSLASSTLRSVSRMLLARLATRW